jgi:proteasome accessory factor B
VLATAGPVDFETPVGFDASKALAHSPTSEFAVIDVRVGKATSLRALAVSTKSLGEWDQIRVPIFNLDSLCSLILWHGLDAMVQEPTNLRQLVIENLQALVDNHG